MRAVLDIVLIVLDLYVWLLIASAILSWLVAFNVVNTRNQFVASVAEFLYRITEPLLAPIRWITPNLGCLAISPIILFLIIMLVTRVITYYIEPGDRRTRAWTIDGCVMTLGAIPLRVSA